MSPARRLFIASGIFHPEAGGPATYLHELLPALQARGWEVRALSYGDATGGAYPYPLTRIPRRALPVRLARYARAAWPLLRWADVTYVHTLGLPLVGGAAPRVLKVVGDQAWERAVRKGWIAPTEDIDAFQTRRYGVVVEAQKAARAREVRGMAAVIVPSAYLKRMVVGWGVDPAQVHVVYNAVPEPPAGLPSQADARAQLGLPAGAPLILTAARLTPWKGIDHLMRAIESLPDVRILVAGDGDDLARLQRLAVALRVENRVEFLGRVSRERLAVYMRAADYTALYSGYEGLSHTLLESLQVGTPVIASDKGGNPEVVQHGVNGLLAPYVDVEALTQVVRDAFAAGRRDALAANSGVGMARFGFVPMVDATEAVLTSVMR